MNQPAPLAPPAIAARRQAIADARAATRRIAEALDTADSAMKPGEDLAATDAAELADALLDARNAMHRAAAFIVPAAAGAPEREAPRPKETSP